MPPRIDPRTTDPGAADPRYAAPRPRSQSARTARARSVGFLSHVDLPGARSHEGDEGPESRTEPGAPVPAPRDHGFVESVLADTSASAPVRPPAERPPARLETSTRVALALLALLLVGGGIFAAIVVRGDPTAEPEDRAPDRAASPTDPTGFAPPVAVPAGTSYSVSELRGSGDLEVTQWIRAEAPIDTLRLAVPRAPGLIRGGVVATDMSVLADGTAVDAPSAVIGTPAATVDLGGARTVKVTYTLSGVFEPDGPGSRRGLLRVVSLDVRYEAPDDVTVTQVVTGTTVLGMACTPEAAGAGPVACGAPVNGVWQVAQSGERATDRVQAQVELPRRRAVS